MKNRKIDELKNDYERIEIPSELDDVVNIGVMRGREEMNNRADKSSKNTIIKFGAGAAVAAMLFTAGVNISPAFADAMDDIPVIGEIVKVLKFTDGKADGGKITDGSEMEDIVEYKSGEYENIVLKFNRSGEMQEELGSYKISYDEDLNVMYFEMGGVRKAALSQEELKKVIENEFVKDVYRVITLDDSLIRFAIEFNKPIVYRIEEIKEPAGLRIQFKEDIDFIRTEKYVLRTKSEANGEGIAILEESFRNMDVKLLKDEEGMMFVYLGSYDTEEEAQNKLKEIEEKTGTELIIEKI